MIKKGVCCIVLSLEPIKFKTMTYKSFASLLREQAVEKLGNIIEHNLEVTRAAIAYCGENNLNYRLSSSIFPLITYDQAELSLNALPNYHEILDKVQQVRSTHEAYSEVRLSLHPDQFNVLASENREAVNRTIKELDFYAEFMDSIGCRDNHLAPINIHMNCSGDKAKLADRFEQNYSRLKFSTRMRLVLENDDKPAGWTVEELYKHIYTKLAIPITFDYLHHDCHPGIAYAIEQKAFELAYETWGPLIRPLFHYSERAPNQNNPRKHADYAERVPNTYGKSIDLDYEFKMKEKSWRPK